MSRTAGSRLLVILLVLLAYTVFASKHISLKSFTKEAANFYQSLTQGFLHGQLNLPDKPDPILAALPNPYDPIVNTHLVLLDASYYKNKYYLYFGPLPVIAFYLPFKLITGLYPPTALGILFFCMLGFIFNFLLLIKVKEKYFPTISNLQLNFFALILALTNNNPYLFYKPRMYEIAIAASYCAISIAIYYLFKVFSKKLSTRNILLFSFSLALSVAGRPHFALICMVLALLVITHLWQSKIANKHFVSVCLALLGPLVTVGVTLALYNYFRFDSFVEFGHTYQVGYVDNTQQSLINKEFYKFLPLQIYFYFFQPCGPRNLLVPPFLQNLAWDFFVKGGVYEHATGILIEIPMISLLLLFPQIYKINLRQPIVTQAVIKFMGSIILSSLIVMAVIFSILGVAQRYESDFLPYLIIISIITFWILQTHFLIPQTLMRMTQIFFVMTSIIGALLGITYGLIWINNYWIQYSLQAFTSLLFYLIPVNAAWIYFMMRTIKPSQDLTALNYQPVDSPVVA